MREERAKSEIGYVLQGSIPKAHVNNSSRDGFCRNMTPPQNREVVRGSKVGGRVDTKYTKTRWSYQLFLLVSRNNRTNFYPHPI